MEENETITTEPVEKLTDQQVMENYLKDPKVVANLKQAASTLQERFRETWFTLSQVNKKTNYKDVQQTNWLLQTLVLSDLAGTRSDREMVEYKILLDKKDKADIIQIEIDQLKRGYIERLVFLEKEKEKYK